MTCPDACILAPGHDGRHIDCRAAPIIVASEAAPVVTTKPRRKYDRRHLCRTADHDCTFQGETCIDCGKCVPMPILPPSAVQESRIMSPGGDDPNYGPHPRQAPAPVVVDVPFTAPVPSAPVPTGSDPNYGAPTLTIVPSADTRPRCARCGQTFRHSGIGAEWHRINRPDCRAEYQRASA